MNKSIKVITEMIRDKESQLKELRRLLDIANDSNNVHEQIDRGRQISEIAREVSLLNTLKKKIQE